MGGMKPLSEPWCEHCGLPQATPGFCVECQDRPPSYDVLRSWSVFDGPLKNVIHSLKYRGNISLGDVLAIPLVELIRGQQWASDLLIPVPLSRKRLAERGYNQVAVVARPLSKELDLAYSPQALTRVRETRTQVGLLAAERRENVTGAFRSDPNIVERKTILLLDDVATTGSTLSAAAEALRKAGAARIYAVTLARAIPHHGLDLA
jgi:ComF family protein